MEKKPITCQHCGQLPGFVKHCEDNKVYYALECDCKSTDYYKSSNTTEGIWASLSKQKPKPISEMKLQVHY